MKRGTITGDKVVATLLVLAAAAMWGCMSLFIRALTAAGFSPFEIVAGRMVVGVAVLAALMGATDRSKFRVRLRDMWIFAFLGLVGMTLYNFFYIVCINLSGASVAIVLLYTSPMFVMVIGALAFGERITLLKVVALALTFVGCVLVAGVLGGVKIEPLALAAGLAGGFFYATYSIVGRIGLERYDALTVTFCNFAFCMVGCLALSDVSSMVSTVLADPDVVPWFLGIGIFCAVLPYLAYNRGLQRMEAGRAAILATSEVLVAGALGIVVYGEPSNVLKLIGMALILVSVVVVNLKA